MIARVAVGLVAAQRVGELVWSRRNERRLRARGAVEHGREHYPAMVALHAAWLASTLVEASAGRSRLPNGVRLAAAAAFVAVQPVRYWAIASLGDRWTTRVLVPPGEPPVVGGPYRHLDHPNYAVVAVELATLPLALGAWRTALWSTSANALVLRTRIRVEQRALRTPA